jgi:hypothetical protein
MEEGGGGGGGGGGNRRGKMGVQLRGKDSSWQMQDVGEVRTVVPPERTQGRKRPEVEEPAGRQDYPCLQQLPT